VFAVFFALPPFRKACVKPMTKCPGFSVTGLFHDLDMAMQYLVEVQKKRI
jgi:hypothetical protein